MSDTEIEEKPFYAELAKTGRANCKKCKEKCENGKLRLAKLVTNPFGSGKTKQWFHVDCLFDSFGKQRATTKRIETSEDIGGWEELNDLDRDLILEKIPNGGANTANIENNIDQSISAGPNFQKNSKDNLFREFRRICAEISNVSGYLEKTGILHNFLLKGSNNLKFEGDLYLWIKLLLPTAVKRIYNLQSKQLVKLFSKIFNADQQEMLSHLEQGDVSETICKFFELSECMKPPKKSLLKLNEVDKFLEKLSSLSKEDEQIEHFRKFTKLCTSNDLKMIIRFIKHDLRINCGAKHILEALNSEAYTVYQSSRNLLSVVVKFGDKIPKHLTGSSPKKSANNKNGVRVQLMCPVSPMLAEECSSVEKALGKYPQGMFSEIKYDGERVQLHKQGNEFKFFSRNLKPVLDHKIARCREFISKAFPKANDLILDSEIIVVDTVTGELLPFGSLGVHKKTQFKSAEVCLFIFDCIYLNGEDLTKKTMKERRKILEENICPIKNHIQLSEYNLIKTTKELTKMIAEVLKKGLEGLVLKNVDGVYEPGKRHWLKIKKDYLFDGKMADTADLVVLGGWFGTGKKGGKLSVFLMGCFDRESNLWKTVTKVSSGIDDKTLNKLQDTFKDLMERSNPDNPPKWLSCKKPMIPDLLAIDPKQMPVWEIIGAEFSKAEIHTADGISIRFPRIKKFRDDKSADQSTELLQLINLFQISREKEKTNLKLLTDDIEKDNDNVDTTMTETTTSISKKNKKDNLQPDEDEIVGDGTLKCNQNDENLKNDKKMKFTIRSKSSSSSSSRSSDGGGFEILVDDDINTNRIINKSKRKIIELNTNNKKLKINSTKTFQQNDVNIKIEEENNIDENEDIKENVKKYCSSSNNLAINIKVKEEMSKSKLETVVSRGETKNLKKSTFDGVILYVPTEVLEYVKDDLKYFTDRDGKVLTDSKKCNHVLHKENFTTDDMSLLRSSYTQRCRHVHYKWLLDSINSNTLLPITTYPVLLRNNIN